MSMTAEQMRGAALTVATVNGLVAVGCGAIAAMPLVPIALDIALGFTAASSFLMAASSAYLSIKTLRAIYARTPDND